MDPATTKAMPSAVPLPRGPFREGEPALLIDAKGRRYLVTLGPRQSLHTHLGVLPHASLIGQEEGTWLRTSEGVAMLALRPTFADYVVKMGRRAQVIYPKDLGPILIAADIYPGARVLEAGLGSGALTLALLRAVGPEGRVVSYENRPEMLEQGLRNIDQFCGGRPLTLTAQLGDVESVAERDFDRMLLDLPEPWPLLDTVATVLRPGGILLCYLPTTPQVHQLCLALGEWPTFDQITIREVLERPWHFSGRSLRPALRMVAHTGFLVTARRVLPPAA